MAEVRKDLNEIVKGIQLTNVKTRYSTRPVCRVTLKSGDKLDFNDKDGLLKLLGVYTKNGLKIEDVVESVQLVEEVRTDDVILSSGEFDEDKNTYICVLYVLKPQEGQKTGRKFRFFVDGRVNLDIIDFVYNQYKKQEKASSKTDK